MLKITPQQILKQESDIFKLISAESGLPLYQQDVMREIFPRLHEEWGVTYPREVKVVPSIEGLRKQTREPSRLLRINEPIISKKYGIPIWFGDATKGMALLGLGYRNGDKRFPCLVTLDDGNIHMFLAGATGHGKSVAINSMILTSCYLYPPWEVNFVMSDAKIAEFKKYMRGDVPPHIKSISASSDPDYILSMLGHYREQMSLINGLYGGYGGAGKYDEFRENSGFAIPRTIIVMDEMTVTLLAGERKAAKIEGYIEEYARLGRNTAFHLLLASQDANSITSGILSNVSVRAALGCEAPISEKILGNDEASIYYKEKGRLILNINPVGASKDDNVHYRAPFHDFKEMQEQLQELCDISTEMGWEHMPILYDEVTYLTEEQYHKVLESAPMKPHTIYLGEPSFIYTDADKTGMLRVTLDGEDQDNLVILGGRAIETIRFIKIMLHNLKRVSSVSNSILYVMNAEPIISKGIEFNDYTDLYFNARSIDAEPYREIKGLYMDRSLSIQADMRVFEGSDVQIHPIVRDLLEEDSEIPIEWKTELNMKRITTMMNLMIRPPYLGYLVGDSPTEEDIVKAAIPILFTYNDVGCVHDKRVTKEKFKRIHVFFLGLNKFQGLGMNTNRKEITFFKQFLQECSSVNMHVTASVSNVEELTDLKNEFRYGLFDQGVPEASLRALLRISVTPVAKVLAFFVDRSENPEDAYRFKKHAVGDESFV